ncbi:MAG TPA: type IV secretory system conjugative DNA transfer family protein [Candidatus Binataceae bacterium]|nr:type IV secretory system conjugative DNA transfer family protein [Candidatus Binataceae bacterium]
MNSFLDDFTRDIPRGLSSRYLKQQTAPQARWQTPDVILERKALEYDPLNPGGKILIGALGPKLVGIDDNRHVLTVAGSRAGKSVTLINNLLFYRGSVLATDPKAELANISAARRAALGQNVHVLDPFENASSRIAHLRKAYNPLAVLKSGSPTIIEDAGLIADALVVRSGQEKDPHWDESAKNFIEGVILHVATDPRYEGRRTLLTVRDLLRTALAQEPAALVGEDEEPLHLLEKEMLQNAARFAKNSATEDLAGALEGAARDFYEKGSNERAGVLSTVRRHTKFLDYTAMRRVLAGHDFDLADLKRDRAGVSVYLCLPASRMGLCNRWLRIFINQLLDAMEREKTVPAAPVLVCLDEFPVLGHMRQLEDAAGQIASFNVKLWVVLQDWGQGKALYKERWETFAGNAGILQFFGNNDLETLEYVSRRLGKTRIEVARQGEVGPEQAQSGLSGRSASMELHDLLTPDEVSRHFSRSDRLKRQLVVWAGYDPMILQRVEYFDAGGPHWAVFKDVYARDT